MRVSCQALVIEHSLRAGALSGCGGRKRSAAPYKPSCGRLTRLAGVNMLHDVGGAATIEQVNIKMVWETVTSSTLRSSAPLQSQTPILSCPQPRRGDNPPGLRCASATVSASNPQHNIIYRDCVTSRWGPFPTACFRFARNLDYVKRLP